MKTLIRDFLQHTKPTLFLETEFKQDIFIIPEKEFVREPFDPLDKYYPNNIFLRTLRRSGMPVEGIFELKLVGEWQKDFNFATNEYIFKRLDNFCLIIT